MAIPFFLIALLGIVSHLQAVWRQDLFGDEVHSLFFFRSTSWNDLLWTPVEPIHPNGYYLLLKVWYALTPSVTALRWWQVGIFLGSCVAVWLVGRRLRFSLPAMAMTLALWTSSAYLWHFTFQLRMYGVGMLLIVLSLWAVTAKRPWLSLVFDWLALWFTYGAALFIIAKWLTWVIVQWPQQRQERTVIMLPALAGLLPPSLIAIQFLRQRDLIDTAFLYWVHRPNAGDWSLALGSFFTGLFLPYFESASDLTARWLQVGVIANAAISLAVIGTLFFVWRRRYTNTLRKQWQRLPVPDRLLLLTTGGVLAGYSLVFGHGWLTGSHVFHIRQLFPVAVVGWLTLGWLVNALEKLRPARFKLLLRGVIVIAVATLCVFNLVAIAADSWGGRQAYAHHFTQLPGTPLIASPSDVELIYKHCHDFHRVTVAQSCAARQIYLHNFEDVPLTTRQSWQKWWLTSGAAAGAPSPQCHQVSIDFWECTHTP